MQKIGLKALKIFRAKATVSMREKYPKIYHKNADNTVDFNRNKDYLYYPSSNENTYATNSPWYAFELIETTSSNKKVLIDVTFDLLNFLNWAIYYHEILTQDYKSIVKEPKQHEIKEIMEWKEIYADMLGTELSEEKKKQIEKSINKKNNFILKPSKFLKLCRLFARGWYEENIEVVGSVKFAHYITNYIINKEKKEPNCPHYDSRNENLKKEVTRLFQEADYEYSYKGFHIKLEKHINDKKQTTYTISILHHEAKEGFYIYSRLYQSHYKSQIQGKK